MIAYLGLLAAALAVPAPAAAQGGGSTPAPPLDNPLGLPDLRGVLPAAQDAQAVSSTVQILVVMTVLALVPSILIMTTSFTRILIVLALLRQALGVPQLPPSQVLTAITLFITMLVMAPTWLRIKATALDPYLEQKLPQRQALELAGDHLRDFMFTQIEETRNEENIYLFLEYWRSRPVEPGEDISRQDVPTAVLIPAFMLSELKTAFVMGFRIYLPFLIIDMVIAAILISMGMMMLPPVLISLPFKLILFVMVDGWELVVGSLLHSFVQPT
jgi:flagellar biosynthetic protein FliP